MQYNCIIQIKICSYQYEIVKKINRVGLLRDVAGPDDLIGPDMCTNDLIADNI